jgi:hypothetical protein
LVEFIVAAWADLFAQFCEVLGPLELEQTIVSSPTSIYLVPSPQNLTFHDVLVIFS